MGDGEAGRALNPSPALLAYMIQMPMAVDEYMYWTISEGGQAFGTAMPAFKDSLEPNQIWKTWLACGVASPPNERSKELHGMNRFIKAVIVSGAAFLAAVPGHAQQGEGPYYGHHMWGGGWSGWFFGPIMMIVFIAIAVVVIVLLVRWLGGPGHGAPPHHLSPGKTPLDILKERFARGEIDKEEFEERRRLLRD
jgi:putative membrane protein